MGTSNPLKNDFHLNCTLQGIRRSLGDTVNKKLPVTPSILLAIYKQLNMTAVHDANVWAACLVLFFGFLRKVSLLPTSAKSFDVAKHACRSDVTLAPEGAIRTVRCTKTIQFQQRALRVPLPRQHNSVFCPAQAFYHALSFVSSSAATSPAFVTSTNGSPLCAAAFIKTVHCCLLRAGILNVSQYSGHSFRRGAASWGYSIGLPALTIKALGDWKSSSYVGYIDIDPDHRLRAVKAMLQHVK